MSANAADVSISPAVADSSLEGEDGSRKPAEPAPVAAKQLGDYRIIREIGHGGMGVVYEAEQISLGRHVALKVLPNQTLANDKHKRRFEREARAAARLHHTNIVPVFGVGEHDGLPYYAMQFIQGLGLDEVLNELKRLQGGRITAMRQQVDQEADGVRPVGAGQQVGEQARQDQDQRDAGDHSEVLAVDLEELVQELRQGHGPKACRRGPRGHGAIMEDDQAACLATIRSRVS